jgi:DNA-binding LytR/AlgR family response regulator
MNKLIAILLKPYPLEERKPAQIKLAAIFSAVVFLFLLLLKPFGNNTDFKLVVTNAAIAGLLTFIAILIDFLVLFPLFPLFFKEEKWTVGRELIFTIIIITSIASINTIAGVVIWKGTISFNNWLSMIFYTALIGIAPATVSILINQARLLRKYKNEVAVINETLPPHVVEVIEHESALPETKMQQDDSVAVTKSPSPTHITIQAENEKDNLTILYTSFLVATSADNYVKVFFQENEKLKTAIIRTTLKRVEENITAFPQFFRCHRTAIVNMALVQTVNGSAQGYRLQLPYLQEEIPVSRNLNQVVKEKLAAIK